MFAKIFALFALVAAVLAAPNPEPKPAPAPAPQYLTYSAGLDYVYPGAPVVASPYEYVGAPLAYSAYPSYYLRR